MTIAEAVLAYQAVLRQRIRMSSMTRAAFETAAPALTESYCAVLLCLQWWCCIPAAVEDDVMTVGRQGSWMASSDMLVSAAG
jgi:uncharacterized membrane protein YjdF